MATLLHRPRPRTDEGAPLRVPPRTSVLAGVLAALWAAGLSLLGITVLVLLGWAAAPHSSASATDAMRTAAQTWLLAHHTAFDLPGGALSFAPLGLLAVPSAALFAAGRRAARSAGLRGLRSTGRLVGALGASYGVLVAFVTLPATTAQVHPRPVSAFGGGVVLASVAGGLGALRETGLTRRVRSSLPERADAVLAAAAAGVAVLVAGGALLAGVSLAVQLQRGAQLAAALEPGAVGGLLLLVLGVACVPNAVLWGTSYAVGPGFAVGTGTVVSPIGVELGAVPAFPLLAGLPPTGVAPVASLLALVLPVAAGAVAGVVLLRRTWFLSAESAALWGGLSGAVAGLATGVLAALSGGALGGGRLLAVGPPALQVGGMAAVELALVGATAAWLSARRRA